MIYSFMSCSNFLLFAIRSSKNNVFLKKKKFKDTKIILFLNTTANPLIEWIEKLNWK